MSNTFNINMSNTKFNDNSVGVNTGTMNIKNVPSSENTALLQELSDTQKKLAEFSPKIADAIGELRDAIEKKDQKTIGQKVAELTTGTAAAIVKSVAGGVALHYLGMG